MLCHLLQTLKKLFLFQGFGSENNSEMPVWIQTLITVSHLFVIFNSSVNFYIYLIKLHIMHNTFRNCCREERRSLSRKATRTDTFKRQTELLTNENVEIFRNKNLDGISRQTSKDTGAISRQSSKDTDFKLDRQLEENVECLEMIQSSL